MFTKACEYGIRACLLVAQESLNNRRINIKEISEAIDSPEAFTGKILQKLVKSNIMQSLKGKQGGFEMKPETLPNIKLEDIIISIDGQSAFTACVLGLKDCSDSNPCPAHKKYKHIKGQLRCMIQDLTLQEMVEDIDKGLAFLKLHKH